MVILPLDKKLRRRLHRTLALAQDILVMEIFNNFPKAVIHGGTAIWRCYGSNRFSEDVDVYLPVEVKKANLEKFLNGLKEKGFIAEKFKQTNNSIFSKFSFSGTTVRFEAVFKNVKNFTTMTFEMSDGTSILVNTLYSEEAIEEKTLAYITRKKVRDLYDIFFLLKYAKKENVKSEIIKLIKELKKPIDEKELKTLIISGSVPSVDNMLEVVKTWAR